jgi:hypothetical protein
MKRKLCELGIAVFVAAVGVILWSISFLAVLNITHEAWQAVDYWLAWASAFSFAGGVICLIIATIAFAAFFDGLCERKTT